MGIETKDNWDKAKIIFEIMAILAAIIYGSIINSKLKNREVNLQLVQMATDILRAEPNKTNQPLRKWAVEAIDSRSGIPLDANAKAALMEQKLPSSTWQGKPVTWQGEPTTWQGKWKSFFLHHL
jgi:hypothetical protein